MICKWQNHVIIRPSSNILLADVGEVSGDVTKSKWKVV